jgi:hypothetical protein
MKKNHVLAPWQFDGEIIKDFSNPNPLGICRPFMGTAREANARYIVASVNACSAAGLSVEDLENGAVERLVMQGSMNFEVNRAKHELQEALAALENEPTQ